MKKVGYLVGYLKGCNLLWNKEFCASALDIKKLIEPLFCLSRSVIDWNADYAGIYVPNYSQKSLNQISFSSTCAYARMQFSLTFKNSIPVLCSKYSLLV